MAGRAAAMATVSTFCLDDEYISIYLSVAERDFRMCDDTVVVGNRSRETETETQKAHLLNEIAYKN